MKNSKLQKLSLFSLVLIPLILGGIFLLCYKYKKVTVIEKLPTVNSAPEIDGKISTLIVPHHDFVAEKRSQAFASAKEKAGSVKTIILVSPNHFDMGVGGITTTDKAWQLSGGMIAANQEIIDGLAGRNLVDNDESAFAKEHGVSNLLGDIKQNFPDASIVPLIIKSNVSTDEISDLSLALSNLCSKNCLLVASVDFSHYQPGALSEVHDSFSISALFLQDQSAIMKAEVDSNLSLLLAIKWAKLKKTAAFHLYANTNSGLISNSRDAESTSYVMGWYEKGERVSPKPQFSFIFGGDMMFDREIDYRFRDEKIYDVWSNFGERVFWGSDLSMANLEGPISSAPIPADNSANNLVFNFPPKTPDVLRWLHMNAVSLANNHSYNNGKTGFANTQKVLLEQGIAPIGKQEGFDSDSIKIFSNNRSSVAIIAIDILATDTDLTSTIKSLKIANNRVIVFPHWGVEYDTKHNSAQERLAHSWIDAGADMIIGNHPHVVQDAEVYKNRPVFYSLGNLLFDQYFSKETQRGLLVAGQFSEDKISLVLLPTISKDLKPELLKGEEKAALISQFRQYLGKPDSNTAYGFDKIEISLE